MRRDGVMRRVLSPRCFALVLSCLLSRAGVEPVHAADEPTTHSEPLRVLFLGDQGHHHPADCAKILKPVLLRQSIELKYTEDLSQLNAQALSVFDCLMVFGNIDAIAPQQEQALLAFVEAGKGL